MAHTIKQNIISPEQHGIAKGTVSNLTEYMAIGYRIKDYSLTCKAWTFVVLVTIIFVNSQSTSNYGDNFGLWRNFCSDVPQGSGLGS